MEPERDRTQGPCAEKCRKAYGNAWERQDADAAAAIFSEDEHARGRKEPIKGREAIGLLGSTPPRASRRNSASGMRFLQWLTAAGSRVGGRPCRFSPRESGTDGRDLPYLG